MNTPWDAQQHEWLQAMGYEVMVAAGPSAPVAADGHAVAHTATPAPAPVEAGGGEGPQPWSDGPLLRALLRAARVRDPQALEPLLPSPQALRGDAGAKRALWPRLRALRRARGH